MPITALITTILGIQYPIIQGGMAWVADGELAAAVSNAGGLGLIACGMAPPEHVANQIEIAKKLTTKPFGLNIMLMSPHSAALVDLACEQKIAAVTTGAGDPSKYIQKLKEAGVKILPVVPSVALAKRMERLGVDAIIAEGMEAGGHIGKMTTMAMIPQVVDAVNIPVVAAGGIGDGRGMAAAFMLGASGVQVGTRFLLAKECNISQAYKDAVIKAKDIDTVVTGNITGHPVRAIKNKFTQQFDALEQEEAKKDQPDIAKVEAFGSGSLAAAVKGDVVMGSVMAGQIAGLCNKEQTTAEIIDEIIAGCKAALGMNICL